MLVSLEISKKRGLSINPDIHHSKVPSSELRSHDTDVIIIFSIISLKNEKLLNSYNNRSKPKVLRLLFDIVVFRFVSYFLNMICLNLCILNKIWYIPILYKFYTVFFINFSGQKHKMELARINS